MRFGQSTHELGDRGLHDGHERGESLLTGIDLVRLGYRVSEHVATQKATHVVLTRETAVDKKT